MATRVPALIQLSDPRVAAQLVINKSKAVHRQKCIEDLKAKESNDPKAFWNIINRTTKHPNTGNVTIDEFFEHFSVLKC